MIETKDTMLRIEHAHGCLAGVALGDALGMPTSMLDPDNIRELFPAGIEGFEPAPKGHPLHDGMVAGQVTDDTEQTLVLADAWLKDQKFVPETVAQGLIRWAKSVNGFDSLYLGPSSLRALSQIRDGVPVEKAGWLGDTNGAAMRIAVAGIVNVGDLDGAVESTSIACLPTHNTNLAISGASAVACAVARGMTGNATLEQVRDAFLYGAREGVKRGNRWIGASVEKRAEMALNIAEQAADEREFMRNLYEQIGASVVTSESVPSALALMMYYEGDPLAVTLGAANLGGDCDTVGAIAGAMAGAWAGVGAIPNEYFDRLEKVNKLKLRDYAEQLVAKSEV
jgi:ADP-ribosylglycohydrolase